MRMNRLVASLMLLGVLPGHAIIFADGDDPSANKETAPTGVYQDSGWQHLVRFKNFQGTMISPKHFITATHLGSATAITQPMYFNGVADKSFNIKPNSRTILQINGENSDLSVFEIWETFENYAPLYTSTDEVGKEFILTGKGFGQGEELTFNNATVGWKWGDATTEADRWGTSTILSTDVAGSGADLIYSQFDSNGGPHECQATGNDSGGGWFIKEGSVWKLAAITFSADAGRDSNNTIGDGSNFRAAMTRARGFYIGSDSGGWFLIPTNNGQYSNPASFETNDMDARFYEKTHSYGTRISSFITELNPIIQPSITTASLSPETRFGAWLIDQGITTNTSALDDADGDHIPNLLEYFSDSDASDISEAISPFQVTPLTSGAIQFTLIESLDLAGRGLTGVIQKSTDLDTWTPVTTATETSSSMDTAAGTRTRILERPAGSDSELFFRLFVSL